MSKMEREGSVCPHGFGNPQKNNLLGKRDGGGGSPYVVACEEKITRTGSCAEEFDT